MVHLNRYIVNAQGAKIFLRFSIDILIGGGVEIKKIAIF